MKQNILAFTLSVVLLSASYVATPIAAASATEIKNSTVDTNNTIEDEEINYSVKFTEGKIDSNGDLHLWFDVAKPYKDGYYIDLFNEDQKLLKRYWLKNPKFEMYSISDFEYLPMIINTKYMTGLVNDKLRRIPAMYSGSEVYYAHRELIINSECPDTRFVSVYPVSVERPKIKICTTHLEQ